MMLIQEWKQLIIHKSTYQTQLGALDWIDRLIEENVTVSCSL